LESRHETLGMGEFHDPDEALFRIGKRSDFLFEHGEKLPLDDEGGGNDAHEKSPQKC
jgi:hypothetical protein